jgi:hypothetical protein
MATLLNRQHSKRKKGDPKRPERKPVACAALWYGTDGSAQRGIVCDVSAQGIFLQPLGSDPEAVAVGSRLRVVFMARAGATEVKVDTHGTVRWVGRHPHFQSPGMGLELEDLPPGLAAPDLDT